MNWLWIILFLLRALVSLPAAGIQSSNASGNLTTSVDALGHSTTFVYDALNRRVQTVYADGTTSATMYDELGRRVYETDQAGKPTAFGYDPLGRMIAVTNAMGQVTRFAYDELGQQVSQTDANNHTTAYEYDSLGRRVKRTLPGGEVETCAYNVGGQLASRTDFNGFTTTFQYDRMNRLVAKVPDPRRGEASVTFAYNVFGQRTNMTDASGVTTYAYDANNRLAQKTRTWPWANQTTTLAYSYDLVGSLAGIQSSDANGANVAYEHDALGRLGAVVDPSLGRTDYQYDGLGNLQNCAYPNGVSSYYQYDRLNRLTNLVGAKLLTSLAQYVYTVGASGNRLTASERLLASAYNTHAKTIDRVYAYDDVYRLTGETVNGTATTGAASYGYDPVGNRLSRGSTLPGLGTQSFTFDANDRLNSDTYDPNGNTLVAAGFGQTQADRYDFENRLVRRQTAAGTVSLQYDGEGNRVGKIVTTATNTVVTLFVVDEQNPTGYAQVLEELESVDGAALAVARVYTYGHTLISQDRRDGPQWQASFYGVDGHNNVRYLTDASGVVTDTYDYDAFGNLIAATGTTPNHYLYSGEQYDPDLGLYYLRARYHNPDTGRFWSMDTYEGEGSDPGTLHKYTYCVNNPVNAVDPSGHESGAESLTALSIRSGITFGFWGAFSGAYTTFRHNGDQLGWNVAGNALVGGAFGFLGGYFLGPLPASAWETPAAKWLVVFLTSAGLTQALQELQGGNPDLALIDASFALSPFALNSRMLTRLFEANYGNYVTLYREVNETHPAYAEALEGMVVPNRPWWKFWVKPATPYEHNTSSTLNSPNTSWTTDYEVAQNFATRPTGKGVVLEATVPRSQTVTSPNLKSVAIGGGEVVSESEVLVSGTVSRAKVTPIGIN